MTKTYFSCVVLEKIGLWLQLSIKESCSRSFSCKSSFPTMQNFMDAFNYSCDEMEAKQRVTPGYLVI